MEQILNVHCHFEYEGSERDAQVIYDPIPFNITQADNPTEFDFCFRVQKDIQLYYAGWNHE